MKRRLSRAKAKIKATAIPFAVPADRLLPDRFAAVLAVVYLIRCAPWAARKRRGRRSSTPCGWPRRTRSASSSPASWRGCDSVSGTEAGASLSFWRVADAPIMSRP
jgi:hypothetical protein